MSPANFSALIDRIRVAVHEAGWDVSILDCIPTRTAAVEKIYLYVARSLIQSDRIGDPSESQLLNDVRATLAEQGVIVIDGNANPLLALAIWADGEGTSTAHPKLGPRATSPLLVLRRTYLRERRRRELDGLLPQRLRGTEAEADRHAAEEWRRNDAATADLSVVFDELIRRIPDERTRTEIQRRRNGDPLTPADWKHLQRRFPLIRALLSQHTELRNGKRIETKK